MNFRLAAVGLGGNHGRVGLELQDQMIKTEEGVARCDHLRDAIAELTCQEHHTQADSWLPADAFANDFESATFGPKEDTNHAA